MSDSINGQVTSFIPDFINFVKNSDSNYPASAKEMTKSQFDTYLLNFLKTNIGKYHSGQFKFRNGAKINENTPNLPDLIAMTFGYTHKKFETSVGYIPAMNQIFDTVKKHEDKIEIVTAVGGG